MNIYAWANQPHESSLCSIIQQHQQPKTLMIGLSATQTLRKIPTHSSLYSNWQRILPCIQFQTTNVIADFAPNTDLYLVPQQFMAQLNQFAPDEHIIWQTAAIKQENLPTEKPWQKQPENQFSGCPNVVVIGAGIAGAATAYELARRGAKVQLLEAQNKVAQAASGHYQGLLYAKISPHPTPQTQLLLAAYGYTHRLLNQLLPEKNTWQDCGLLHLNHNANEIKRNQALASHTHHQHLYRFVNAIEASQLANIPINQDGLFWPHGAWLNPASFIHALIEHPNITLHTQAKITQAQFTEQQWHIQTEDKRSFSGSHIVFCTGADSRHTPIIQHYPTQLIRGQTSQAHANEYSRQLQIALSGSSYISPAWQNQHCFGATFINNNHDTQWHATDQEQNWVELHALHSQLANHLFHSQDINKKTGHAAIRCDSHDHLPIVGALGNVDAMQKIYAKLALDKNYRLHTPCPYYPNAYANIAHGSRGLCTAPICAAQIAAEICGTPHVLHQSLRHALQANRLIIRKIIRSQFNAA